MATVHFVFQKKGGVGKSLIATMWFQFLDEMGLSVFGIDTDPANHTFAGFKELGVKELNILNKDKDIDPRMFDALVESIFELTDEDHLVIDSGSSCFVSLMSYLIESHAFETILAGNHRIFIHVPVTGGSDMAHTTACLDELVSSFPEVPFIVWKNQYHGDLALDGKEFEDFKTYKKHSAHFAAVVNMPQKKKDTFGKDIEGLLARKHTFKAAINSSQPLMVRQRLKTFWGESCEAMNVALEAVNSEG